MNIQQLRYIVAIDRFRNFARAADSCHISQPTLSAMVRNWRRNSMCVSSSDQTKR
ncbi:LysR family transcriptional regulator [Hallella sp.]|uniref:LysR family transcriptional regulator n=1 Tax=Hallella sp. TaxID=2980186 RepID=UPI00307FA31C